MNSATQASKFILCSNCDKIAFVKPEKFQFKNHPLCDPCWDSLVAPVETTERQERSLLPEQETEMAGAR